jgi:hypothetical protein
MSNCQKPGSVHRIRNCSEGLCSETGTCGYRAEPAPSKVAEIGGVSDFSGKVDGGGYKASMDDPSKLPLWLVPVSFIRGTAAVLQYGKRKYAANNWRKGMAWSEVYSALLRHLTAWQEGEENDVESGLSHLWHAACCLAFLIEYATFRKLYGRFDDRFKRPEGE